MYDLTDTTDSVTNNLPGEIAIGLTHCEQNALESPVRRAVLRGLLVQNLQSSVQLMDLVPEASLKRMRYHLDVLIFHGLLEVVEPNSRNGLGERIYVPCIDEGSRVVSVLRRMEPSDRASSSGRSQSSRSPVSGRRLLSIRLGKHRRP